MQDLVDACRCGLAVVYWCTAARGKLMIAIRWDCSKYKDSIPGPNRNANAVPSPSFRDLSSV